MRDPDYALVLADLDDALSDPQPQQAALAPVVAELAGPHTVDEYLAFALAQNPEIQAARKRVEAQANRVPQAASLPDPIFGATLFPGEVETAAGQQQMLLTAAQLFPWFGKLDLQSDTAEAETDVARAELAAAELDVFEQVRIAYYELYFLQRAIQITEENRELLVDFVEIADRKYRVEESVSQQDVLRAELEVLDLDNELIRLRQQLDSAQADLAEVLHISPETGLRALPKLATEEIPRDIEGLYELAVALRPEVHAQLATIERDRRLVDLARLEYFPDVTAGVTWIDTANHGISPVSNGRDATLLGLNINVPIYRKRLDAGVREAEAQTVSDARRYDALRDRTLKQVKDLFARVTSEEELVRLFLDDIIPKADQTLRVSITAYEANEVDFLQLIDNWEKLLQVQIVYEQLEAQLRQSLASLERIVGTQLLRRPSAGEPAAEIDDVPLLLPIEPDRQGEGPPEP